MNLHNYHFVMVNSSAGKDSQTALYEVVRLADQQGYERRRIVVAHADLGEAEWPGTKDLAEQQAKHYGLEFYVQRYRDKHGDYPTLLDYVRRRGKWPSSTTRYCTSEFKRTPCSRVFKLLQAQWGSPWFGGSTKDRLNILNVFGFRAEESPARAKRKPVSHNKRFSSSKREITDWLPIHEWKEKEVWDQIHLVGVPHHYAYDLGMPRLSCRFCIFAPRPALLLAGQCNGDLLQKYVDLEREMGHDFQHGKPIRAIQLALSQGATVDKAGLTGVWNM